MGNKGRKPFQPTDPERGIIKNVVVTPYSKILKWQYVCELLGDLHLQKPLDIVNNAKFDVIAISDKFVQHKNALYLKDVSSYVREHNIPFDIKAY